MAEPAVEELKGGLRSTFPEILPFPDPKNASMPRLQAAPGDHSTNPSYDASKDPHAQGLALDIVLHVEYLRERQLAEHLVKLFIKYKRQMGWSAVIYNRITTDDFGGPKPHTGKCPHITHVHVEWPKSRAGTRGFIKTMQADLDDLAEKWYNNDLTP